MTSDKKDQYLSDYEAFTRNGAAGDPSWLDGLRSTAIEHFADSRFPTTRDEEWRFTSVAPIVQTQFVTAHGRTDVSLEAVLPLLAGSREWSRLVFVDGQISNDLSKLNSAWERATVSNIADAAA